MTPERDKQLCEKYPKIFAHRDDPEPRHSIACGVECGDGWYDLLDTLCANIQAHVDHMESQDVRRPPEEPVDRQVLVTQVKSKFGGLRFYTGPTDDVVRGMISFAESMSFKICETCGHKGARKGTGWIHTMCAPCWDTYQRRRLGL
jgi:hypothetical protein